MRRKLREGPAANAVRADLNEANPGTRWRRCQRGLPAKFMVTAATNTWMFCAALSAANVELRFAAYPFCPVSAKGATVLPTSENFRIASRPSIPSELLADPFEYELFDQCRIVHMTRRGASFLR